MVELLPYYWNVDLLVVDHPEGGDRVGVHHVEADHETFDDPEGGHVEMSHICFDDPGGGHVGIDHVELSRMSFGDPRGDHERGDPFAHDPEGAGHLEVGQKEVVCDSCQGQLDVQSTVVRLSQGPHAAVVCHPGECWVAAGYFVQVLSCVSALLRLCVGFFMSGDMYLFVCKFTDNKYRSRELNKCIHSEYIDKQIQTRRTYIHTRKHKHAHTGTQHTDARMHTANHQRAARGDCPDTKIGVSAYQHTIRP